MSDVEWTEEAEEAPRKKRRIPKWVWIGCGGGCLLAVGLAVAAAVAGTLFFQKGKDPEYVWPRVDRVLPFDERPAGYRAYGQSIAGTETWFLLDEAAGRMIFVQVFPNRAALDDLFDPESRSNRGLFGVGGISDAEPGEVEIQGRSTRCLRFFPWVPGSAKEDSDEPQGATIRVDLSGDEERYVSVQITLPTREERVSDELVRELLQPFDVWHTRDAETPPAPAGEAPPAGEGEGD
ncbi:MAG: hypothetical protein AB1726_13955 [Planctomycetota bacterium]